MHEQLGKDQALDTPTRSLLLLVGALIATTFVVFLPEMTAALQWVRFAEGPKAQQTSYWLFRLPRELMLLLTLAATGYYVFVSRRQQLTGRLLVGIALAATWAIACAARTILVKDVPLVVPLLGLRMLQFTPLALAGFLMARQYGAQPLTSLARFLRVYVGIVLMIAIAQLIGETRDTGFRPRAVGAFSNENAFGAALVACSLFMLLVEELRGDGRGPRGGYLPWGIVCLGGAVASGSRTAIALCAALVVYRLVSQLGGRKLLLPAAMVVLVVGIFVLATNPWLSGRIDAANSFGARLSFVREVGATLQTPGDFVFGGGVGLYSTATATLLGQDRFPGQVHNTHSSFLEILASFGLGGLVAIGYLFWISTNLGPRPQIWLFVFIVALMSVAQPVWAMFPTDVLLWFLWGSLLGIGAQTGRPDDETSGGGQRSSPTRIVHQR